MAVDIKPKNIGGVFLDVFNGGCEFDATCFASTTGMHLGFDHDGSSELFSCADRLLNSECDFSIGDRHSELFEELFALIFEEVHGGLLCRGCEGQGGCPTSSTY